MKIPGGSFLQPVCSALLIVSELALGARGWPAPVAAAVEIVEVRAVGVSAAEESKSIIQVKWRADAQAGSEVKAFDVGIEVSYADGAVERRRTTAGASARSARFELPTLHFSAGRPGAELRSFKASVVVSFTETAFRQGPF